MNPPRYIGRFAPSPTGPLHFGSLVAALGSWLQARAHNGQWLVRMEDLDRPREEPGAADAILRALDHYGLGWDGEVLYQSRRDAEYHTALAKLIADQRIYLCDCSRREISQLATARGLPPGVYPGSCRTRHNRLDREGALRLLVEPGELGLTDGIQGHYAQLLEHEVGDFVLRRRDGLFAYQLAVVVDDAAQGISEVVRGSDLLDSTPRQIYLQRVLGLPTPNYLHLPVALASNGQKLSKQNLAPAVALDQDPRPALLHALTFLGQNPDPALLELSRDALLKQAIQQWRTDAIPACLGLTPSFTARGSD